MDLKILVINLMHIGDLLLVTPVLRVLRNNHNDAHIALLADAKLADLVRLNPCIDELIAWDKKGEHNRLGNYLQAVNDLRKKNFDIVINLHQNERASFAAAFSGGKKIVGYSTWGPHLFFDRVMKNRKAIKHQVDSHYDVLREHLEIEDCRDQGLEMLVDEGAEQRANDLWRIAFKDIGLKKIVGLNVGASWPTKRWRKEHYANLADRLLELGYGLAFFGGPMDVAMVKEVQDLMRQKAHPAVKTFTGKMTLMELACLLKKCDVLVTNDSGPMHVAVAMGVKVVTMFGPSPVPGFYPYNDASVSIKSDMHCHPCGKHQCPTDHECMRQIGVDLMLKYTLEQLETPRKYGKGMYIEPNNETFRQAEELVK